MIIGIGIDTVDLDRIAQLIERNSRFASRVLTEAEILACNKLKGTRVIEFVAGRYAAKKLFKSIWYRYWP